MLYTDDADAGVRVLVSQKKWAKVKRLMDKLHSFFMASDGLDHNDLYSIMGFVVYMTRNYKPLNPFLIGLHLNIDSWILERDDEGSRIIQAEVDAIQESEDEDGMEEDPLVKVQKPPGLIKAVPRFIANVEAMIQLTEAEDPPLRRVRASKKMTFFTAMETRQVVALYGALTLETVCDMS
jgi:hypothetical protein